MTGARLRIAAVGDVMCGESFYQYGNGPRSQIDRLGAGFFDPEIGAFLRSHDLVFANLECVLSDVGYSPRSLRSHQMRGRPEVVERLRAWGITVVNVANNHIFEHGRAAALDTVARLRAAGISVVGAGAGDALEPRSGLTELTVAGMRVGVLGACLLDEQYAFSGGLRAHELVTAVRGLAAVNDLLLVSLHWGTEYMDRPGPTQRQLAHALVEAGARFVLGHHPHVVQGVENYCGAVIAYSLGNFVFDQPLPDTRWSVILSVELDSAGALHWECQPVMLDEGHRPHPASGPDALRLRVECARRNGSLASAEDAAEYAKEAYDRNRVMRRLLHRRVLRAARWVPGFPASYPLQLMLRPLLRRLKRW